jgi:hypothetical protein
MIAQILEHVKLQGASEARAALVAIRDELVTHVSHLNQSIDLLDLVVGPIAVDGDEHDAEEAPRRGRKAKASKPSARGNGHAAKAFGTRNGKPSIAARIHEALADAPAEGWTSEDCVKRVKGIDARRASITLAALAKSGRAKKVSYGHYVLA